MNRNELEDLLSPSFSSIKNIISNYNESLILILWETNDLLYLEGWKISFTSKCVTGKNWFGNEIWSRKTPLWLHKISWLYWDKMDITTIFKWRKHIWNLEYYPEKWNIYPVVLSRILQLVWLEEQNSNTEKRYIYIHWTPNIWYWDTDNLKRSYGCISLKPTRIVELFEKVKFKKDTYVYITK